MSDLSDSIETINTAAERTEATTDFIDNWSTYDENSYVTNPNNNVTVPSAQKLIMDKVTAFLEGLDIDYGDQVQENTANIESLSESVEDNELLIWMGI